MNTSDYNEKTVINVLASYIDPSYSAMEHRGKEDDFDFISQDCTWALEVTRVITVSDKEYIQYEAALKKGKCPDPTRVDPDASVDEKGISAYIGQGTEHLLSQAVKRIVEKIKKANRHQEMRPSVTRMDLAISFPKEVYRGNYQRDLLLEKLSEHETPFAYLYFFFQDMLVVYHQGKTRTIPIPRQLL